MSWRIGIGVKNRSFDWYLELDEKIPDKFFEELWGYRPLKIIFLKGYEITLFEFLEKMVEEGHNISDIWAIYRRDERGDLIDYIEHSSIDEIKELFLPKSGD